MLHLLIKLAAIKKIWVNSHTMVAFFWKFSIFLKKSVNWKRLLKFWKFCQTFKTTNVFFKTLVTSSVLFWVNFHTVMKQKKSGANCTKLFLEVFGKSCGFLHVDPCPK